MLEHSRTVVFDSYWRFIAKRQEMMWRRLEGRPPEEWTDDPILRKYRFTNVQRLADRVSQHLLTEALYERKDVALVPRQPHTPEEVFFWVMLYKFFNKPETWSALHAAGLTRWEDVRNHKAALDAVLTERIQKGPIYSAAYIMPPSDSTDTLKHRTHLDMLWRMMGAGVGEKLATCTTFSTALRALQAWPIMGDFLAAQFLLDLDYSEAFSFAQDTFPAGPGARSGLVKMFGQEVASYGWTYALRRLDEMQERCVAERGLAPRLLYGKKLKLSDLQNCCCEVDKAARKWHPEVPGLGNRLDIKQVFKPRAAPLTMPLVPPKFMESSRA